MYHRFSFVIQDLNILNSGFPQRLEILENENGLGKVMEHEQIDKKSLNFFYQSWTLPNLSLSSTNLVPFF